MRRILILALLTLTSLLPHRVDARAVELPITPDPATCDADAIDIDRLVESASPTLVPTATPSGTVYMRPASSALVNEMAEVVIGSLACTNANQPLRALAYYSEEYLRYRISDEPVITLGHLRAAATREPDIAAEEDRLTLASIYGHGIVDDKPFIMVETRAGDESTYSVLSFVDADDGWLIDAAVVMQDDR